MNFPSSSRLKRTLSSSSDQRINQTLASHGSAILALFVFLVLVSFGFALWMLKIWIVQEQFMDTLGRSSFSTASFRNGQSEKTENTQILPAGSLVAGLNLAYRQCPSVLEGEYMGNCDDYSLYRENADGSKVVIFPSVRALIPSTTSTLAYPARYSHDGRYIILRMSKPPFLDISDLQESNKVFMYDAQSGSMRLLTQEIPVNAVFSADNKFAAYIKENNDDYREVVVVDLLQDTAKTVAKAKRSEMFWNGVTPPKVKQFDGKSLVFEVYTSSDATHALPTLQETRTIELGK